MDLCLAETDEEAELRDVKEHRNTRRCFTCGSINNLHPNCPLLKTGQDSSSQTLVVWYDAGKRGLPEGSGRPSREEIGSVEPLGGSGEQNLAPKSFLHSNTGREYNPCFLVTKANVKGFEKPWSILRDSGASGNYVRRCSLDGNQCYPEALQAQISDTITVRLATRTLFTVPKVPVNLNVKFTISIVSNTV